ncbi:MAG: hypothetical protein GY847_23585 [Proteobacteria bacterium]|nr:hypothetical protein [Pseudomonadota bacterium]
MRLLDVIFDRRTDPDVPERNQTFPLRNSVTNDKEVITVDPMDSPPGSTSRPPIIFENGLE